MENKMFCFQCEQTAGCAACTGNAGVCGKKSETAALQDELTGALVGLARAARGDTEPDENTYKILIEGLFTTVTNVSFDDEAIRKQIEAVRKEKERLVPQFSSCGSPWGQTDDFYLKEIWEAQVNIRSLKSLIPFGIRGLAAYASHARVLGYQDREWHECFSVALYRVASDNSV